MLYQYEVVEVKQKINKKKIFICSFILIIVIGIAIYFGIKFAENKNEFNQDDNFILTQENRNNEIEKQKEEKRLEQEKLKNANPFTEEQINSIENIYTSSNEKRVFLTFDDGPTQTVTPYILDLLKKENIKATFFVLGNRASANADLIQREFNEGHYIANHGYTHVYSQIYQNSQKVMDEYNYTEECIQKALQNPNYHSRVFRFPGGSSGGYYNTIKNEAKQNLRDNGIVSLDWNALSKDAEGAKTTDELLQNVINTVGKKQSVVILMHDASDKILTYETLPNVIQYLRENGYEFKTLYDII